MKMKERKISVQLFGFVFACFFLLGFQQKKRQPPFRVIAFYTAKNDAAHISYVHEANRWFPATGAKYGFSYDSTQDWNNLNESFLSRYDVVIFLDTRPDLAAQREAFKKYMDNGGAWMGFHFAGFALTPSAFPQDWDWYHNKFLGSGSYVSNTWRPTSATLRVEDRKHPATWHLPPTFKSSPNEWYRWANDLRSNPDKNSCIYRLKQFSGGNRSETSRDMAQWLLSRCMDKPALQNDLRQHGA